MALQTLLRGTREVQGLAVLTEVVGLVAHGRQGAGPEHPIYGVVG
ncbi:hypothetical protein [Actinomadura alba]